jgi:uncharacterized circularly permuted ATP-grasp superfamily protein
MDDATDSAASAAFDEARDARGRARAGYGNVFDALHGADLEALRSAVGARLEGGGVSFGAHPFVVDPVPRLIGASEWEPLAAGLAQRASALNALLRDVYGDQRAVQAGVVAADAIERAEGFAPDLRGRLPTSATPAAVVGFDLVRAPDGEFLVLEDNLRTPSGFAYAVAARVALAHVLPARLPRPRPIDPLAFELLAGAIRAAAPAGRREPVVVVLTDGPANSAHYEHRESARRLGATLATLDDLVRDGDALRVRRGDGTRPRVDVVYRRTDEDAVRHGDGALTPVARVLLEPWLRGEIGLVNAFGTGVADDKAVHGLIEDCIRFYLDEEPLVRSVPTQTVEESGPAPGIGELRRLVTKPRSGYGGNGVMIGAHARDDDLGRRARALTAHPERYISQPIVPLSRHPTVIDGRLEPRHVDLRAFAFCGEDVRVLPGGLTRVALDAGALVVNSSQDGGGKDTWVIE